MKHSGVFENRGRLALLLAAGCFALPTSSPAAPSKAEVEAALKKAAVYYAESVAFEGGYVYYYSPDLSRRLGEGVARPTEIWVQPPGTPTVGMAFLDAYLATGDGFYLDAAIAAGKALIYGQLESGGWRNSIDFDSSGPRVDQYRNGKGRGKNYSTLDDRITQSALTFLMKLDEATRFGNSEIHEAVEYGLDHLLDAQFSNGAFPQVWLAKVKPVEDAKGNYPDYDWRTEGRIKEYWDQYTLNDRVASSVTEVLITAHQVYKDDRFLEALRKLGGFLIQAQMPDPQPAWAQQYNENMQPIWARKFEPPAISGRESEDVMIALLKIYEVTKDETYLQPIIPAVKYLEASLLPDGRQARYYELETNKPLYMERKGDVYSLTNDDSNLPSHYGWKNDPRIDLVKDAYRGALAGVPVSGILEPQGSDPNVIEKVVGSLDEEGRWLSTYSGELLVGQPKFREGEQYLNSEVFSDNVRTLSSFLRSAAK